MMCKEERWFVKSNHVKDELIKCKTVTNKTGGAESFKNTLL